MARRLAEAAADAAEKLARNQREKISFGSRFGGHRARRRPDLDPRSAHSPTTPPTMVAPR